MGFLFIHSAVAAAICLLASVQAVHTETEADQIERLLDAIAQVESRSDHTAVGDGGRAIGIYQIHRRYWQDGTRILGTNWPYADAADPAKAKQVVRAYLRHYGKDRSLLEMARIHNGGPNGHKKESTRDYARKIETILDALSQSS
jgi:hypothetical protein